VSWVLAAALPVAAAAVRPATSLARVVQSSRLPPATMFGVPLAD